MTSKVTLISTAAILTLTLAGCAPAAQNNAAATPDSSTSASASVPSENNGSTGASPSAIKTPTAAPKKTAGVSTANDVEAQLLYLIEEEKLAHDVYTAMYDLWGARVFGNILKSETTHQSQVLTLLSARDIEDPRSSELGVFENDELQALYDQLIAKGEKSAQDAFEVGVAIEELDIKDITDQLATAKDADVIATLERLRAASENHLRAFNAQL